MILNYFIILIAAALLQFVAPWWMIVVVPLVVHIWRPTSYGLSFLSGFMAIATTWLVYGWYQHDASAGMMTERIAQIFTLPNPFWLLAITVVVGGLVGGFAAMTGFSFKMLFIRSSNR